MTDNDGSIHGDVMFNTYWFMRDCKYSYRGADKSLAGPGRKQATFPAFYGTWRFINHIHKSPPPVPILAKLIHSSAHYNF